MQINLNNPDELTLENVREFIRTGDDSKFNQLKVTEDGIAYFSEDFGQELERHRFYMETLDAGNDYVGEAAANDDEWVKVFYESLRDAWQKDRRGAVYE